MQVSLFLIGMGVLYTIFKTNKIMATLEQFQTALADINDATNNIAADIERLAGQISGGMTADQEAEVLSQLQGAAERLRAVAATTPEDEESPEA